MDAATTYTGTAAAIIPATDLKPALFNDFIAYIDRGAQTTKTYITNLRQFAAWLQYKAIRRPQRQDIISYRDYLTAEQLLLKIEDSHYTELLADDALFKLGDLYEFYIHDPNKAMDCYRKLMRDFPSSLYVNDARNRYRALRGDN